MFPADRDVDAVVAAGLEALDDAAAGRPAELGIRPRGVGFRRGDGRLGRGRLRIDVAGRRVVDRPASCRPSPWRRRSWRPGSCRRAWSCCPSWRYRTCRFALPASLLATFSAFVLDATSRLDFCSSAFALSSALVFSVALSSALRALPDVSRVSFAATSSACFFVFSALSAGSFAEATARSPAL